MANNHKNNNSYFDITKVIDRKVFKCPYKNCNRQFQEKGNLRTHIRVHTGERPFKCRFENCGKSFITLGNLKSHHSNHTGEKPFACGYSGCGMKYSKQCRLKIHERTHLGDKPYKCPFENCEKSFNEKGNLKTHFRIHTGEKPYICSFEGCSHSFKALGHLKDHLKRHYNIRPYKCENCSAKFARTSTLKIHYKKHYKNESFKNNNFQDNDKVSFKNDKIVENLKNDTTSLNVQKNKQFLKRKSKRTSEKANIRDNLINLSNSENLKTENELPKINIIKDQIHEKAGTDESNENSKLINLLEMMVKNNNNFSQNLQSNNSIQNNIYLTNLNIGNINNSTDLFSLIKILDLNNQNKNSINPINLISASSGSSPCVRSCKNDKKSESPSALTCITQTQSNNGIKSQSLKYNNFNGYNPSNVGSDLAQFKSPINQNSVTPKSIQNFGENQNTLNKTIVSPKDEFAQFLQNNTSPKDNFINLFYNQNIYENSPFNMNSMMQINTFQKDLTPNNMNTIIPAGYSYSPMGLNLHYQKDNIDFTSLFDYANKQNNNC